MQRAQSLSQHSMWWVFCSGMLKQLPESSLMTWHLHGEMCPQSPLCLLGLLALNSFTHLLGELSLQQPSSSSWRMEPSTAFLFHLENAQITSPVLTGLRAYEAAEDDKSFCYSLTTVLFQPGTNSSQSSVSVLLNLLILVDYPITGSKCLWGWSGSLGKQEATASSENSSEVRDAAEKSLTRQTFPTSYCRRLLDSMSYFPILTVE